MESSWLFLFLPYLPSNCLGSEYGGGWCHKGDRDNFLQKTLHRHPHRAAALGKTEPFSRDQNISLQWELPSPSPESLHGSSWSAQHGICMAGHTSCWDRSHSCTLLSPALQLLLGAFGQVTLCLSFPNCKMETRILHFAATLVQEYRRQCLWCSIWMQYLWYTIYQQGSTTNAALSLQLALLLFYWWNLCYQKLSRCT